MNIFIIVIMSISILFIILMVMIYISVNWLKHKKYKIVTDKLPASFNGLKIVHITDVHSKIFGKNNSRVINMVNNINPDIVVMTGDIISQFETDIDGFIDMYKEIYKKYPVFYSIGNHERKLGYTKFKYYMDKLRDLGVHVLINGTEKYYKGNDYIVINILKFRENIQYKVLNEKNNNMIIKNMKESIDEVDKSKFNILLSHDPENYKLYKELGVDLIFSGHDHGGLIRLGKKCLLSPRRKFFPKYAYGKHEEDGVTIITSSGMGPARIKIRLFNRPEIVEINIVNKARKE